MRKFNPETRKFEFVENPLATVGQLIDYLSQFDRNTKVAVNVNEEPSEVIEIIETTAEQCNGRDDGLVITAEWNPKDKVILIKGNQY